MEGVAFALTRQIRNYGVGLQEQARPGIASRGGAKVDLWLTIKSSAYGGPVMVPEEAECSVVGLAALAGVREGAFLHAGEAATASMRSDRETVSDPAWTGGYARMQPVYGRLYLDAQAYYDDPRRLARMSHDASPTRKR
jgi:xylulokinase